MGIDHFVDLIEGGIDVEGEPGLSRRGISEQIAVRTRYFDDFFRAAAESGIRQAVILAAGLDTRAFRLAWPADTTVFELDQPEVIEFKTRTLAGLGAEPSAHHRTVSIDLRDDWPTALRAAGFDPTAPTAWIAEGLLIYLPPAAQDKLLDGITALSAPGSRIATEEMDVSSLPENWSEALTERMRRIGSNINLAELFYTGTRHTPGAYLAARGWRTEVLTTAAAFAAHGFTPDPEMTAFEGDDSGYLSAELN